MSENNKHLQDSFKCKFCKKYLLDPVLLPCRNNICEEHIIKMIKENSSKCFKCDLCHDNHEIPENGFIINEPFIEMMKTNAHLDERTKTAQKQIDNLDDLSKEIDLLVKDPEDFIYSYFAKEKNKIDLKRETLISKIHDISEKMINEIKQMEVQSKSNLKVKQQNLIDSNKFDIKQLNEQVLAWKDEIRDPNLNKNRLEKIIEESKSLFLQNKTQSFEAKNKILNEKGCYFVPKKDEFKKELFGELVIDNFSIIHHCQNQKHDSLPIKLDSNIVNSDQSIELIKLCEFENKKEFKLLYRASRDGFSSQAFHSKCNAIRKTLTTIKVKDQPHIFGGYTDATWETTKTGWEHKQDPNAFIFSLVNNDNKPIKMKKNQNDQNAIYCNPSYGPIFGGGWDFVISSDSNTNKNSSSNLGWAYQHPNYQFRSNEAQSFLAGSRNFSTSEIEVFEIK